MSVPDKLISQYSKTTPNSYSVNDQMLSLCLDETGEVYGVILRTQNPEPMIGWRGAPSPPVVLAGLAWGRRSGLGPTRARRGGAGRYRGLSVSSCFLVVRSLSAMKLAR
jgi:hypothetical protein